MRPIWKTRTNRKILIPNNSSRRRIQVTGLSSSLRFAPEIIIFDVDGVLVDVRGSFHKTVLETVRFFTGKQVTARELHRWKNQSGFNDDWKLSTTWVQSLGGKFEYPQVKSKFVEIYWGQNGDGNVRREKWLLPRATLRRLAALAELALFTGRVREEIDYTLDRCHVRDFFRTIVTVEDVKRPKPDPEGLLRILKGREPAKALYLGDNIDDAISSHSAGIPFVGVLPRNSTARSSRIAFLRKFGAKTVLGDVGELEAWLKRSQPPPVPELPSY
jgi:HAD superfamily hydrolase (TIGR01548 family)